MEQKTKGRRIVMMDSEEETPTQTPVAQPVSTPTAETKPMKNSAPSKKPNKKPEIEDVEKYCFDVVNEMRDLYRKDIQLNQAQKPAYHKIENVESICSKIIKKDVQEAFIRLGILKELRTWLEPLPDNSLPNQKIKRAVLELLGQLRIKKDDLLSSGIGKIVNFYSKNQKEAQEIRRISTGIVKKWKSRIIQEETCTD